MGYVLRYEYGMFRQVFSDGWQQEQPDNWLQYRDPWEVARPQERVEVKLNASYEVREGGLRAIVGKPSTLIGIPYDRPVVGYGGKSINTLRLWAASATASSRSSPGNSSRRPTVRAESNFGGASRTRVKKLDVDIDSDCARASVEMPSTR